MSPPLEGGTNRAERTRICLAVAPLRRGADGAARHPYQIKALPGIVTAGLIARPP